MENVLNFKSKILCENDLKFPEKLKKIKKPPKKLYVVGNLEILNKPAIAIVGSRNYSEYGKRMAKKFTKELVNEGFAIVSGLATGIDSFAHKECIYSGGKTIAVIASGVNKIYPKENIELYRKILQSGGCVITEYSDNIEANKKYFPNRNRLISGLSLATLVIEANYRSGTSITARFCIEQGRKLFCIPNSLENKNASGVNNLLKKGANLVTQTEDIIKLIGKINNKVEIEKNDFSDDNNLIELSGKKLVIYKCLINGPKFADEISNLTGFQISDVNSILSLLEIENYILKLSNNMYKVNVSDK